MANENKFTKGEWFPMFYGEFWHIQLNNKYGAGSLLDAEFNGYDQAEANAKVMAAAPDLLEVANCIILEADMREETGLPQLTPTLISLAKAAIKKATE
jgi:hypothetical protein